MANLVLMLIWAFLRSSYTLVDFCIGYLLGAVLLAIFQHRLGSPFYLRKVWSVCKLFCIFLRELVKANFQVFFIILHPQLNIKPGIIKMEIFIRSPLGISLLANMITLTPGTLTMEISPDNRYLFIHVLNINNGEEIKRNIRKNFEDNIMEVIR